MTLRAIGAGYVNLFGGWYNMTYGAKCASGGRPGEVGCEPCNLDMERVEQFSCKP